MKINKLRQVKGYLGFCGADASLQQLASELETRLAEKQLARMIPAELFQDCNVLLFKNRKLFIYSPKPECTSWLRNRQLRLCEQLRAAGIKIAEIRPITTPRACRAGVQKTMTSRSAPKNAARVVADGANCIENPELRASLMRLSERLASKQREK